MAGQKLFHELPIDSTVSPGNSITVNLPVNKTIEGVQLKLVNLDKSELSDFRLSVNSRLVSEWRNVAEMEAIDKYYDLHIEANRVFIRFSDKTFDTIAHQNALSLGTVGADTVTLTFKIASAVASADPIDIKASAIKSAGTAPGTVKKVRYFPDSASAGRNDFINVSMVEGARIKAIHLFKAAADISKVELKVDGELYVDVDKDELQSFQRESERVPQPGMYTLDWSLQGDMFETLKIPQKYIQAPDGSTRLNDKHIKDFRLQYECDTPGQVYIVVEYIDAYSQTGF